MGSQANIARALKITEAAVSKWPDPIPKLREYQIKDHLEAKKKAKLKAKNKAV